MRNSLRKLAALALTLGAVVSLYALAVRPWFLSWGSTEAERMKAVKRGQRLDESKPGSGLGLSIVADLAHLYKGRFELKPSPDGGLRARLTLPAA